MREERERSIERMQEARMARLPQDKFDAFIRKVRALGDG
jgi:hypothetical protein